MDSRNLSAPAKDAFPIRSFLIDVAGGFSTVVGSAFVQDIDNTARAEPAQAMSAAACAHPFGGNWMMGLAADPLCCRADVPVNDFGAQGQPPRTSVKGAANFAAGNCDGLKHAVDRPAINRPQKI